MFYTNTCSPVNLSRNVSKRGQAPSRADLDDPRVTTASADRLRQFIDRVLESIDDPVDGEELARRVHLSRSHFDWSAAIAGRAFDESSDRSLDGLIARLDATDLVELVKGIASRGSWDTAFVDATCDPPESFTPGGAAAHALRWDAHRRLIATSALNAAGGRPPSPDPLATER
jgi:hypothetical protein